MKRPSHRVRVLTLALYAILIICAAVILLRILEYRAAANEYKAYEAMMSDVLEPAASVLPKASPGLAAGESGRTGAQVSGAIPAVTQIPYFSAQIQTLKASNSDTVGYLEIPDTAISYPVVRGSDNRYYETHTFAKRKNASGAIFMDCKNAPDLSDFNIVIYGHNMKDGSMFHELIQYEKSAYLNKHRNILLTGLYEKKTFYVFAAYTCEKAADVRGFGSKTDAQKQSFLNKILARSDIGMGTASPTTSSQYITLVTCRENSAGDYFVVHGVLAE